MTKHFLVLQFTFLYTKLFLISDYRTLFLLLIHTKMNVFFAHVKHMHILETVVFRKHVKDYHNYYISLGLENLEESQIIFLGWI